MEASTGQVVTKGIALAATIFGLLGWAVAREISDAEREQVRQQMRSVMIPKLEFQDASLEEVVKFLNKAAADLSPRDGTGQHRNLEMRIRRHSLVDGDASPGVAAGERAKITLSLENVPLADALEFCAGLSGCAVVIAPPEVEIESCVEIVSVHFRDVADAEPSPTARMP